jgi:hypothetical protein
MLETLSYSASCHRCALAAGLHYHETVERHSYDPEDLSKALRLYQHVLELDPTHNQGLYNTGVLHRAAGRYAEAESAFEVLVSVNPTIAHAWYELGVIRLARFNQSAGVRDIQHACALATDAPRDAANAHSMACEQQQTVENMNSQFSQPSSAMRALVTEYGHGDEQQVRSSFSSLQRPSSCASARFMIYVEDDQSQKVGLGFMFRFAYQLFMWARVENRVLVEAVYIDGKGGLTPRWRWCEREPFGYKCFFRDWSPCEQYLRELRAPLDIDGLPAWERENTMHERFVVASTEALSASNNNWLMDGAHGIPWEMSAGKLWWSARVQGLLLQPQPWLEQAADRFIGDHFGSRPFLLLHIRAGSHPDRIPTRTYLPYLLLLSELSGVRQVLLQTESLAVAQEVTGWSATHNISVRFTENQRGETDSWNVKFMPADAVNMTELGRIAVLNHAIGRHAVAAIGCMWSGWFTHMASAMDSRWGGPVPVLSLGAGAESPFNGAGYKVVGTRSWVWQASKFKNEEDPVRDNRTIRKWWSRLQGSFAGRSSTQEGQAAHHLPPAPDASSRRTSRRVNRRELFIGNGVVHASKPDQVADWTGSGWANVTTTATSATFAPDVVWDMRHLGRKPAPLFDDASFEEVHAFGSIPSLQQHWLDLRSVEADLGELWRIVAPDGLLCGSSPSLPTMDGSTEPRWFAHLTSGMLGVSSRDSSQAQGASLGFTPFKSAVVEDVFLFCVKAVKSAVIHAHAAPAAGDDAIDARLKMELSSYHLATVADPSCASYVQRHERLTAFPVERAVQALEVAASIQPGCSVIPLSLGRFLIETEQLVLAKIVFSQVLSRFHHANERALVFANLGAIEAKWVGAQDKSKAAKYASLAATELTVAEVDRAALQQLLTLRIHRQSSW